MLPDGNGVDFLAELRRVCAAPVLFLTAKNGQDDILAGLTAGGNDYITKPYSIDEFRMRLVKSKNATPSHAATSTLSTKELSLALLVACGMANKEIACEVYLSENRVKHVLSDIYRKFGISGKDGKRGLLARIMDG